MKNLSFLGIVLIVLGVIALSYDGFHYTQREQVLKLGSLTADADVKHDIPVSSGAAAAVIVAGVVCLWAGSGRTKNIV
jgi:hypothetical protein